MGCPRGGSSQSKGPGKGTCSLGCLRCTPTGVDVDPCTQGSHAAGCSEVGTRTHARGPVGFSLLAEDT